ncbi:MAG: TerB family tellurite resistance protein [Saccharofermentans sp.]|nr:TerB family tellurite resistance protein [Saccharofermentans sp.]
MLLDELSRDEKIAFWNAANVLAAADGSISEEESILKQYAEEMGDDFGFVDPDTVDIYSEISTFKSSSVRTRKIVYFELYSVAYADTEFDAKEKRLLDDLSLALDISGEDRAKLESCVETIFGAYRRLGDVLGE